MEHKIVSVIQKIDGCGSATVAISYKSEGKKDYAYQQGNGWNNGNILFANGQPIVVESYPPTILGVVVVAEGANDPIVKMKIVNVVVTLLDVASTNVQVFTYKN